MAPISEIEKLERRYAENPLGLTFASLAEAHRKVGNHARAFEVLELGLAQHPNYVPAHIVRGRCHLDSGTLEQAELAFLRVTELDPENVIGLKSLADLSERGGRYTEAAHRLEALLEVDRSNEEARDQLARVRNLAETVGDAPPPPPKPAPSEPAEDTEPPAPGETAVASEPATPTEPAPPSEPAPAKKASSPAEPMPALFADEIRDLTVSVPMIEAPTDAAAVVTPKLPPPTFDDENDLSDLTLYAPEDLRPDAKSEFQLPSDAESLKPGGTDRLEDVVLGAEIPGQELPVAEVAAGEGTAAEPSEERAATEELPGAELTPEPIVPERSAIPPDQTYEAGVIPEAEASAPAWAGSAFSPAIPELGSRPEPSQEPPRSEPVVSEASAPGVGGGAGEEPSRESPVVEAAEAETASEPELEPLEDIPLPEMAEEAPPTEPIAAEEAPVAEVPAEEAPVGEAPVEEAEEAVPVASDGQEADADSIAAPPEPALVVTESMAEVFLRQGHKELALAVYTQLAQREPTNSRVVEASERLRAELAPPVPVPSPVRRFDAASTGGMSIGGLLRTLFGAPRPAAAAPVHPPAFETPRRAPDEPPGTGREALSLSAVFGEEPGTAEGPASPPPEPDEAEPSFDEFFTSEPPAELPSTPPKTSEAAAGPSQSGEDLERFNAWLRGLKR